MSIASVQFVEMVREAAAAVPTVKKRIPFFCQRCRRITRHEVTMYEDGWSMYRCEKCGHQIWIGK
jgi:predicted SprT family Zn-dependent metalloprotease